MRWTREVNTYEKNKWRGLYVDYKEGKFISPKIVIQDDTTEFLARTKNSFEILKMACIMILELSDSDALTEDFAALVVSKLIPQQ